MRPVLMLMLALTAGCAERSEADAHKGASLDDLVNRGAAAPAAPAPAPAAGHAQSGPAPLDALTRLLAGNARFVGGQRSRSAVSDDDAAERVLTAKGQHPFAAVLTCADSRLSPELIFDQSLGDLFVVRNAGNIAEPIGEGSLEYAIEHLGVRLIVVMGHSSCGAVKAVSGSDAQLPGHLADIQRAMPGLRTFAAARAKDGATPDAVIRESVERNAGEQAAALLAGSPALRQAVAEGRIAVVPATYDLASGQASFQAQTQVQSDAPSAQH